MMFVFGSFELLFYFVFDFWQCKGLLFEFFTEQCNFEFVWFLNFGRGIQKMKCEQGRKIWSKMEIFKEMVGVKGPGGRL